MNCSALLNGIEKYTIMWYNDGEIPREWCKWNNASIVHILRMMT